MELGADQAIKVSYGADRRGFFVINGNDEQLFCAKHYFDGIESHSQG